MPRPRDRGVYANTTYFLDSHPDTAAGPPLLAAFGTGRRGVPRGVERGEACDARVAQRPRYPRHHRVLAQAGAERLEHAHQIAGALARDVRPGGIAGDARLAVAGGAVLPPR